MKQTAVQQEIMLLKGTSFAQKQLFENDAFENRKCLNSAEQLEIACWNGWLHIAMPEVVDISASGNNLYLWKIMQANRFLNIELCEYPQTLDVQFSINPYAVLATVCYE